MFYVKRKHKKVAIQDPIYTTCPQCGVEHQVDLVDILRDERTDLYSTMVYCHKCSQERAKHHRGQEWAEQIVREDV